MVLCKHCDEDINYHTYKSHKRAFYDNNTKTWTLKYGKILQLPGGNKKPVATEEKTNDSPTAGATQKDTVKPVDTSNSEESKEEGDESSCHKVGRKRKHSNASSSNSPSKPKKSGKEESNSPQ